MGLTNMLINIYVTNAANLEYFNMCYPCPMEKEPGREQGLTVLLYESFYDG